MKVFPTVACLFYCIWAGNLCCRQREVVIGRMQKKGWCYRQYAWITQIIEDIAHFENIHFGVSMATFSWWYVTEKVILNIKAYIHPQVRVRKGCIILCIHLQPEYVLWSVKRVLIHTVCVTGQKAQKWIWGNKNEKRGTDYLCCLKQKRFNTKSFLWQPVYESWLNAIR